MKIKKIDMLIWGVVALVLIVSAYFYPQMPENMASHWNINGEADGFMSKFWGLFIAPIVMLFVAGLFMIIPIIDPLKKNIEKFRKHFDNFILLITVFFGVIQAHIILWNMGTHINPSIIISFGCGLLFYYAGELCEHSKMNWFIGIRTPWTLSSEKVWDKTNKLGGKLFKLAGLLALIGAILPSVYAFLLIIIPALLLTIFIIIYSYLEYRREEMTIN